VSALSLLAIPLGALVGLGARRGGGKGIPAAAAAAAVAAAGIVALLGFASRGPLEEEARARADAVSRADYDRFGEAARDWDPRLRGDDAGRFAQAWNLLPGSALDRPGPRIAEFERTTIPLLDAWRKKAPEFEEWRTVRRAAILREAESPWASFFASPLRFVSVLDFLSAAIGLAAAGKLGYVSAPTVIVRKRPAA
jgi:hypothetical protein